MKHYEKENHMWEDFTYMVAKRELKSLKAMTIKEMEQGYFWLNNIYKKHADETGITPETRKVWQACSEYLDEHVIF